MILANQAYKSKLLILNLFKGCCGDIWGLGFLIKTVFKTVVASFDTGGFL